MEGLESLLYLLIYFFPTYYCLTVWLPVVPATVCLAFLGTGIVAVNQIIKVPILMEIL